jgi:hypothetical protein
VSRKRYAEGTDVPIEKSEGELKAVLRRYGADSIGILESNNTVNVLFELKGRRVVIRARLPARDERRFTHARVNQSSTEYRRSSDDAIYKAWEQACRQTWRALLLCVKAKLESVEAGIETFDQAFLAHVMLPTGETVGEWAQRPENLPAALEGRTLPPLLPGAN